MRGLALALAALAGLAPQAAPPQPPQGAVSVRIDGPSGLLPLASALRNALREQSEDIDVALGEGLSGKARLDALSSGASDLALAGPGLDLADLAARGLTAHRIAVFAVVFAVHADVGVLDLSPGALCDIFAGRVASWDALGGPAIPVRAFLRPDSEVDTEVARAAIPCLKDLVPGKDVAIAQTSNDMRIALQSTPGAIGLTTSSAVLQSIVALRMLSLASVPPTPGNVVSGRYPLVRPAYLVTLASPPPSVRRFLDFVRSDLGAEAIRKAGALPVDLGSAANGRPGPFSSYETRGHVFPAARAVSSSAGSRPGAPEHEHSEQTKGNG